MSCQGFLHFPKQVIFSINHIIHYLHLLSPFFMINAFLQKSLEKMLNILSYEAPPADTIISACPAVWRLLIKRKQKICVSYDVISKIHLKAETFLDKVMFWSLNSVYILTSFRLKNVEWVEGNAILKYVGINEKIKSLTNVWSVIHQSALKHVGQFDCTLISECTLSFLSGDGSEQARPIGKAMIAFELMAV